MIWFLGSPVWFQKLSSMILLGSFLPLLGPFQLGIFCDSVLLTVRWTKSTERCKQYASWHKHLSNNWGMIVVFFFFHPLENTGMCPFSHTSLKCYGNHFLLEMSLHMRMIFVEHFLLKGTAANCVSQWKQVIRYVYCVEQQEIQDDLKSAVQVMIHYDWRIYQSILAPLFEMSYQSTLAPFRLLFWKDFHVNTFFFLNVIFTWSGLYFTFLQLTVLLLKYNCKDLLNLIETKKCEIMDCRIIGCVYRFVSHFLRWILCTRKSLYWLLFENSFSPRKNSKTYSVQNYCIL